ncbi:hypothetical protein EELLY_v1c02730 [Entomoplasma ellychniae]|uniref:Uncharacterized protein n=1 Tax=Entomoplasma ellychniae TaxID=2114 RepID=A0A8E2UDZ9_9MOLU|nr:hypothetical protein [Entomoplasma ellychniae]PPE04593.1 hypothetical protein EELLY_v1c02730 [Entomoplasma ellychniae]
MIPIGNHITLFEAVTLPFFSNTTLILLQYPAKASSIELSTIFQTKWWRPRVSVEPIYISGRFSTAFRSLKTWIADSSYLNSLPLIRFSI